MEERDLTFTFVDVGARGGVVELQEHYRGNLRTRLVKAALWGYRSVGNLARPRRWLEHLGGRR